MNLPQFSIKKPVTTMMILVCLVVLGIVSLTRLSLDMYPEISSTHLHIRIPYPASSPEEVERIITIPVEDALGTPAARKFPRSWCKLAIAVRANAGVSASRAFHQTERLPCGSVSITATGPCPAASA